MSAEFMLIDAEPTASQKQLLTKNFFQKLCNEDPTICKTPILAVNSCLPFRENLDYCNEISLIDADTVYVHCVMVKELEEQCIHAFGNYNLRMPVIKVLKFERYQDENDDFPTLIIKDFEVVERGIPLKPAPTFPSLRKPVPEKDLPKMPGGVTQLIPLKILTPHVKGRYVVGGIVTQKGVICACKLSGYTQSISFCLTDSWETTIRVTAFDDLATELLNTLKDRSCYYLSDQQEKGIKTAFRINGTSLYEYEINLSDSAILIPTEEKLAEAPNIIPVPLIQIQNKQLYDCMDVYAVVDRILPAYKLGRKLLNCQDVQLVDTSRVSVTLRLLGSFVGCMDGREHQIVAIKSAVVRVYQDTFTLIINTPTQIQWNYEYDSNLKDWYEKERSAQILFDLSIDDRHRISSYDHVAINDVQVLHRSDPSTIFYTICATAKWVYKENMIVKSCKNCGKELFDAEKEKAKMLKSTKPNAEAMQLLYCTSCPNNTDTEIVLTLRPRMVIFDENSKNDEAYLTLKQEIAVAFFGKSADELSEADVDRKMEESTNVYFLFRVRINSFLEDTSNAQRADSSTLPLPSFYCVNYLKVGNPLFMQAVKSQSDSDIEVLDEIVRQKYQLPKTKQEMFSDEEDVASDPPQQSQRASQKSKANKASSSQSQSEDSALNDIFALEAVPTSTQLAAETLAEFEDDFSRYVFQD